MGKTFNATVDWLGMVENPDQNVNPSVNGEIAQTGMEFEAPKRDGARINSGGSESTHIMKTETIDGINWVSFPTLFQNEDGSWNNTYELMLEKDPDNWRPAMLEAKRRGELIHFGPNKKEALEYGEGSWKAQAGLELSMCSNGEWNGESVKTGCGYRDSAHNLYGSAGMTLGDISDKSMSGSARAGLGYSTHIPYSPVTGHLGLSGGTRLKGDEQSMMFNPILDATGSVGIEGEFGGNSYNWREPWKYGAGIYGRHDLVGGTGTTAGLYGNVGLLSGKVGYNPNTGAEATIGFGLPIRRDGGSLPKAQQGYEELFEGLTSHLDEQYQNHLNTGIVSLEKENVSDDEFKLDPNLLPASEYQNKIRTHTASLPDANEWRKGHIKYPDNPNALDAEGNPIRARTYYRPLAVDEKGYYETPFHSSGLTGSNHDAKNCIHGVCKYAMDAGVTSLAGKNGDGQFMSNAEFADKYADREGFVNYHNPWDGRSYGDDLIYAGDIIQKLTQSRDGRHMRTRTNADGTEERYQLGEYRPHHAYMVVDAGNPTHSADRRVISLGHNQGGSKWIVEKYTLQEVLDMIADKQFSLNAYDPDLVLEKRKEKENIQNEIEGNNKYAKQHSDRELSDFDFRWPGPMVGGWEGEMGETSNFMEHRNEYQDGESIDYMYPSIILETYKDNYYTLGKMSNMSPEALDLLVLNQIGVGYQESGKNKTKYASKNIFQTIMPDSFAKNVGRWLTSDDGNWEDDYWNRNVNNVQDEFRSKELFIKDMYKHMNKSARQSHLELENADMSRGMFQQKELSDRGIHLITEKMLPWMDSVDFQNDYLKLYKDKTYSTLSSITLAMDNFHLLKKLHNKLGTKVNGKPLTDEMLVDLATLAHNAPRKAMTKQYVEYYYQNHVDGKKNDDGGIAYLDNVDLYKGWLVNRSTGKRHEMKGKKDLITDTANRGNVPQFQDGGPTSERDKYIQFALDTESGYHYIRNKDSAVKKLGANGKWDGKTYYKIYEDGKYYPHYVGDEKRATIGHGHAPVDRDIFGEYQKGIDETQALKLLGEDIDEKLRLSEIYYNQRFGDDKWNDLTESEQFMLNDYTFNVRGGFHKTFKNFAKAIHDKDFKSAKKEYKRALGERNEIFMNTYLKPWMDIQQEKTTVAPPLNEMVLPIGTHLMDMTKPEKKKTSWWKGEEGWMPDELELPWFMDGAPINARGSSSSSATEIPDGSAAENATMSRSAMDPMPSLNNDLTINDNLALSNTISDLSEETTIAKYGGQYMWGLDLRSTKAQAGKEVKSDDIYANDRYSQSAAKYKKMLPKYQNEGQVTYTTPVPKTDNYTLVAPTLPEVEVVGKDTRNWLKRNYQDYISPIGHGALDVIGVIPAAGELADGLNAAWYAAEGNKVDAALSTAAMIPFAGWAATGTKWTKNTIKAMDKITPGGGDIYKKLKTLSDTNPKLAKDLKFKNKKQIKKMLKDDPTAAQKIIDDAAKETKRVNDYNITKSNTIIDPAQTYRKSPYGLNSRTSPARGGNMFDDIAEEYVWLDNASQLNNRVAPPFNPRFNESGKMISFDLTKYDDYVPFSKHKMQFPNVSHTKFKTDLTGTMKDLHSKGFHHMDMHGGNVLVQPDKFGNILDYKIIDPVGYTHDFQKSEMFLKNNPAYKNYNDFFKNGRSDDLFRIKTEFRRGGQK